MKSKRMFSKIDKPLLFICVLYSCIGILFILSASSVTAVLQYDYSPYHYFIRQLVFVTVAYLLGFIVIFRVPTRNYKKIVPLIIVGLIAALILILLYGEITNSVKSWINLGFFSPQPSEFIKLAVILYLGVFFGDKLKTRKEKYAFVIPLIIAFIIFILVAMQPDLGTAVILAAITFFVFLAVPFDRVKGIEVIKISAVAVGIIGVILLLSGVFVKSNFLTQEQKSRFNYQEPCSRYTEKTGYQVCNAFIAISNGGLFGKGIGKSTQKYLYLPEAHTDMIFPIVVEECGIIFGIILVLGYVFILYRILKISKECVRLRNSIICYGIMIYILIHLVLNFCGILALTPLTGVPVPFLSYGGSFNLNLIFSIFIVERIATENKVEKSKIEIQNISRK